MDQITEHQIKVKQILDMKARPHNFLKGDEVLLWDKRKEPKRLHAKFYSLWKVPFIISEIIGPNTFHLSYLDGTSMPFTYNGQDLKLLRCNIPRRSHPCIVPPFLVLFVFLLFCLSIFSVLVCFLGLVFVPAF